MPQASEELRAKFPGDDTEAWDVLNKNFNEIAGVIFPKVAGYQMTEREGEAIDYLSDEWDYGYSPVKLFKRNL